MNFRTEALPNCSIQQRLQFCPHPSLALLNFRLRQGLAGTAFGRLQLDTKTIFGHRPPRFSEINQDTRTRLVFFAIAIQARLMVSPGCFTLTQFGQTVKLFGSLAPHRLLAQGEKAFSGNTLKNRMYWRDHVSTHYLEKLASKEKTAIRQQPSPVPAPRGRRFAFRCR